MNKQKILIVEDNFIVMLELKDRLTELGYEVVDTAASGEEAIEKAHLLHPDLTLMDIRLKGEMDGIEAAGRIKKELDIPVIYLTAHTDDETLERAKVTEPLGYIIKPFEERELHSTIEMGLYKNKMEKKLKEKEHWLSATLKSIGDALIATDSNGVIKLINPVAEKMTGWKYEEAIGLNIKDVFVVKDEDETILENPVSISLRDNSIVGKSDKILISQNGSETPIDFSSAPIKDENASQLRIIGVVLVFRDITERMEAKDLIEKQRIFLREIIDIDPNYITVKDAKGKFELANKAMAEALGTTTDELVGRNDNEYSSFNEFNYQRKLDEDVIHTQEEIFMPEEKLIDSKGKVHLLQTFRRAINSQHNNEKLVLAVASDITALKLVEKALEKKAAELAEINFMLNESEKDLIILNASKDKFFSIIAHDLRNPFMSLLGLTEYLFEESETIDKAELKTVSESLFKSANNTFDLLEGLLQWARVKTGRIKYEPVELNLNRVLAKTKMLYNSIGTKKGISLTIDVDDRISVFADLNMLETILRNLISNAIKFSSSEDKIHISAKEENNFVKISVADTGIGMSKEITDKLFQVGFNVTTAGTENETGSGLGLILCKEFIDLNKGEISVESEPGKGSTFSFTLPTV